MFEQINLTAAINKVDNEITDLKAKYLKEINLIEPAAAKGKTVSWIKARHSHLITRFTDDTVMVVLVHDDNDGDGPYMSYYTPSFDTCNSLGLIDPGYSAELHDLLLKKGSLEAKRVALSAASKLITDLTEPTVQRLLIEKLGDAGYDTLLETVNDIARTP